MSKASTRLEHLTGQAKRTIRATEQVLRDAEQLEREIGADAGKVERHLTDQFAWAFLYELPHMQLIVLLLMATGQLGRIHDSVRGAEDPAEAILGLLEKELADDTPIEWSGGTGGQFTKEDVLAVLIATIRTLVCQGLYGAYMSELVERVRHGNDEALFSLLRVDRTAICCPSVAVFAARRLARAEVLRDKRYTRRFLSAIKGKPPGSLRANRRVRITLQYLFELGLLKGQAVSKDDIAFIQEVSGYSRQAGAERGLAQLVWRWRSERKDSTQKEQNDVVAPANP